MGFKIGQYMEMTGLSDVMEGDLGFICMRWITYSKTHYSVCREDMKSGREIVATSLKLKGFSIQLEQTSGEI